MDWNQVADEQKKIMNQSFQNVGYSNNRENKKILLIDSNTTDLNSTNISFSVELQEPFLVDKLSDIYLDSFTTFDSVANTSADNMGFLFSISEFNIGTNSNNSLIYNRIFIPNDSTAVNKTTVHKGKKMNYICSINPCELKNMNITISLLNGTDGIMADGDGRFIAELVFISRD